MKNINLIIKKEAKSLNIKKELITIFFLVILIAVWSIGQVGTLEKNLGLDEDGLFNLMKALTIHNEYSKMLTEILFTIAFIIPNILFNFYIGMPYMINFYNSEKKAKNLLYLMIAPIKTSEIIFGITLYAYLKIFISSLINYFIINLFYFVCGFRSTYSINLLVVFLLINLVIICVLLLINSCIWFFNGNSFITNILRVLVFGGIVVILPMISKLQINYSNLSYITLIFIICLLLLLILTSKFFINKFNKEKLITSLIDK